jgi:type II secretory pathway pseudopilin PulG
VAVVGASQIATSIEVHGVDGRLRRVCSIDAAPAGAGQRHRLTPDARRPTGGFSLLELLIVVAFSGLLLQQAMVWKIHKNDRAAVVRAVRDIEQLRIALLSYYAEHNSYPHHLDTEAVTPSGPAFVGGDHLPVWNNVNVANISYTHPTSANPNPGGYGVVGLPENSCVPKSELHAPCIKICIITRLDSGGQASNVCHRFRTIAKMVRDRDLGTYTITIELGRPPLS